MDLEKTRGTPLQLDVISGEKRLAQFSELLDSAFGLSVGAHFLADFPVWARDEGGSGVLRVGAFGPAGRLAGCAAARMARLSTPSGSVPVGIIGAVATDPLYRGRGVASQTVTFLLKWLAIEGAAMTVLWGSETEFYARLGFRPFGAQLIMELPLFVKNLAKGASVAQTVRVNEGWTDGIFTKMRERRSGLLHSEEDVSWLREHRNVEWLWSGSAERPDAYVGYGRGIDLQGMVHEWGGEAFALLPLLARVGIRHPDACVLASREMSGGAVENKAQPMGLAVIHDPMALLTAYGLPLERMADSPEEVLKDPRTLFGDVLNVGLPIWFWGLDSA